MFLGDAHREVTLLALDSFPGAAPIRHTIERPEPQWGRSMENSAFFAVESPISNSWTAVTVLGFSTWAKAFPSRLRSPQRYYRSISPKQPRAEPSSATYCNEQSEQPITTRLMTTPAVIVWNSIPGDLALSARTRDQAAGLRLEDRRRCGIRQHDLSGTRHTASVDRCSGDLRVRARRIFRVIGNTCTSDVDEPERSVGSAPQLVLSLDSRHHRLVGHLGQFRKQLRGDCVDNHDQCESSRRTVRVRPRRR